MVWMKMAECEQIQVRQLRARLAEPQKRSSTCVHHEPGTTIDPKHIARRGSTRSSEWASRPKYLYRHPCRRALGLGDDAGRCESEEEQRLVEHPNPYFEIHIRICPFPKI